MKATRKKTARPSPAKDTQEGRMKRTAFALAGQPGDVELMMAGTLALLKDAGFEIHVMAVANGSCSLDRRPKARAARIRRDESIAACAELGASYHESLVDDFEITYGRHLMPRMCTIMRDVNPEILLLPSPEDVTEDSAGALRLALTASFVTGSGNVITSPKSPQVEGDVTLYHAPPRDLCDRLRRAVPVEFYVDVSSVMEIKRRMLACHESQAASALVRRARITSRRLGKRSGRFAFAEAWRRHLHFGYSRTEVDPLAEALGKSVSIDKTCKRMLNAST